MRSRSARAWTRPDRRRRGGGRLNRLVDQVLTEAFVEYWGRLLALLVGQFRRLDLAEDGLADAYAAAADRWRVDGVPDVPAAWLLTAARRRILDRLRSEAVLARKVPLLVVDAATRAVATESIDEAGNDSALVDDRLRLVFLCAHPVLSPESAAALTLRLVLGVSTNDLARLFLSTDTAMSARLTRAKRTLAAAGASFAMPEPDQRVQRLGGVLASAYLAFTAAYAPPSGSAVVRPDLAAEAVRLTRLVRDRLPAPEVDALLALMLLQHSRRDARVGADQTLVLLPDQDRTRWRGDEIGEGLALVEGLRGAVLSGRLGDYLLQARIAAEHARAATADDTRWDRIAEHYQALERLTGSPIVRLNQAVAVAEAAGPDAGLALLSGLSDRLPGDYRVPGIRARLLATAGRTAEARTAYEQALACCRNEAVRIELSRQRDALSPG